MSGDRDIGRVLREWPHDPQHNVRVEKLQGGREVLQVRLPLGVEQYEMDGRPDGCRPRGAESLLDYHLARLAKANQEDGARGFSLTHKECTGLFDEGVMYYYRYLRLFQIEDWERVVRDTSRNLTLFDFVHHHAARPQDKVHLEKWRPYVMRMRAMATAMSELAQGHHETALGVVQEARVRIDALDEVDDSTFMYEQERSLEALAEVAEQLEKSLPLNELDLLERDLLRAVKNEEFERAARLRDRIMALRSDPAADTLR